MLKCCATVLCCALLCSRMWCAQLASVLAADAANAWLSTQLCEYCTEGSGEERERREGMRERRRASEGVKSAAQIRSFLDRTSDLYVAGGKSA